MLDKSISLYDGLVNYTMCNYMSPPNFTINTVSNETINWTENFRLGSMVACFIKVQDLLVGHPLWWFITSMKVIIILSLNEQYFWPNVVAIEHILLHLTSADLWPLTPIWRYHHHHQWSSGKVCQPRSTVYYIWPLLTFNLHEGRKVIILLNLHQRFF